jgi:chloramphenicol 3-O-phosphotransferase
MTRFRLTGIAEPPDTPFAKHPMRADIAPYWLTGSHRKAHRFVQRGL